MDRAVLADAGEHVLQGAAFGTVVEDVVDSHHLYPHPGQGRQMRQSGARGRWGEPGLPAGGDVGARASLGWRTARTRCTAPRWPAGSHSRTPRERRGLQGHGPGPCPAGCRLRARLGGYRPAYAGVHARRCRDGAHAGSLPVPGVPAGRLCSTRGCGERRPPFRTVICMSKTEPKHGRNLTPRARMIRAGPDRGPDRCHRNRCRTPRDQERPRPVDQHLPGAPQVGPLTRFDSAQAGLPVYAAAEIRELSTGNSCQNSRPGTPPNTPGRS